MSLSKLDKILIKIRELLGLGGVIESGDNENGSWVKWADGTMICYGEIYFPSGGTVGNKYQMATFPQPFINTPNCSSGGLVSTQPQNYTGVLRGYSKTTVRADIYRAGTAYAFRMYYQAIGRWK